MIWARIDLALKSEAGSSSIEKLKPYLHQSLTRMHPNDLHQAIFNTPVPLWTSLLQTLDGRCQAKERPRDAPPASRSLPAFGPTPKIRAPGHHVCASRSRHLGDHALDYTRA